MTHEAAIKQALEALKNTTPTGFNMETDKKFFAAIKACEEVLAKQEQGELVGDGIDEAAFLERFQQNLARGHKPCQTCEALARTVMLDQSSHDTTPQQRTWVGLTSAEWSDLYEAHHDKYNQSKQGSPDGMDYERAIEAKLKEKNT